MDQYTFILYFVVIPGIIIGVMIITSAYEQLKYCKPIQTNQDWLKTLDDEEFADVVYKVIKKCNDNLANQEIDIWCE